MSEKSEKTNPFSAAIGKASGVFTRPKLQRRAFTAHAASELISAARLSNVLIDLKTSEITTDEKDPQEEKPELEQDNDVLSVLSPCLGTCHGDEDGMAVNSQATNGEEEVNKSRRSSDSAVHRQNSTNKPLVAKDFRRQMPLRCYQVREIITDILKTQLANLVYNHKECGEKSRVISQMIEKKVKSLNKVEYKITVVVFIGAIRDQGIEIAAQSLWAPGVDYFALATYKNETLFASGIVFATIFE